MFRLDHQVGRVSTYCPVTKDNAVLTLACPARGILFCS